MLEAPPRFELGRIGFADLCLTTWPWCRLFCKEPTFKDDSRHPQTSIPPLVWEFVDSLHHPRSLWSGRRDSDPRLPPWQGGILPLNHSRRMIAYLIYQTTCDFATYFLNFANFFVSVNFCDCRAPLQMPSAPRHRKEFLQLQSHLPFRIPKGAWFLPCRLH